MCNTFWCICLSHVGPEVSLKGFLAMVNDPANDFAEEQKECSFCKTFTNKFQEALENERKREETSHGENAKWSPMRCQLRKVCEGVVKLTEGLREETRELGKQYMESAQEKAELLRDGEDVRVITEKMEELEKKLRDIVSGQKTKKEELDRLKAKKEELILEVFELIRKSRHVSVEKTAISKAKKVYELEQNTFAEVLQKCVDDKKRRLQKEKEYEAHRLQKEKEDEERMLWEQKKEKERQLQEDALKRKQQEEQLARILSTVPGLTTIFGGYVGPDAVLHLDATDDEFKRLSGGFGMKEFTGMCAYATSDSDERRIKRLANSLQISRKALLRDPMHDHVKFYADVSARIRTFMVKQGVFTAKDVTTYTMLTDTEIPTTIISLVSGYFKK